MTVVFSAKAKDTEKYHIFAAF